MDLIRRFHEQAAASPRRIVYPEGSEERILQAAVRSRAEGIALPILIGEPAEIAAQAARLNLSLDGLAIVDRKDERCLDRFAAAYAAERGLKESIARSLVRKPLAFGGMMVKLGEADGMVGGIASATASVIQAAAMTIGFSEGIATPSSLMLMVIPEFRGERDAVLVFADCAVTIAPTSAQLAGHPVRSHSANARTFLGIELEVAFLSFSTRGSASHADTEKVIAAVSRAREINPALICDGELQADAALIPRVGAKKAPDSVVAGKANVLIFPDLDAGTLPTSWCNTWAALRRSGPSSGVPKTRQRLVPRGIRQRCGGRDGHHGCPGSGDTMNILVFNCGSSSIKYKLFGMPESAVLAKGGVERLGESGAVARQTTLRGESRVDGGLPSHEAGLAQVLRMLTHPDRGALRSTDEIMRVAIVWCTAESVLGIRPDRQRGREVH